MLIKYEDVANTFSENIHKSNFWAFSWMSHYFEHDHIYVCNVCVWCVCVCVYIYIYNIYIYIYIYI